MSQRSDPQRELEKLMGDESIRGKKLCLHSCCAPCSSYCLLYLSSFFEITVFYYNPNISVQSEYAKRAAEQQRLILMLNRYAEAAETGSGITPEEQKEIAALMEAKHPELSGWVEKRLSEKRYKISYHEGEYKASDFYEIAAGLENEPERGSRCMACYRLRLGRTAAFAAEGAYDFFASTLTLSPLKDAAAVNRIGAELSEQYKVAYLPSDFKKKNGYLLSIMLSELFGLYRQDYCGCVYSRRKDR